MAAVEHNEPVEEQEETVHEVLGRCAREGDEFESVWLKIRKRTDFYKSLAWNTYQSMIRLDTHAAENAVMDLLREEDDAAPGEPAQILPISSAPSAPAMKLLPPSPAQDLDKIRALMRNKIIRVEGESIHWNDMTIAQHRWYAEERRKCAAGNVRTAVLHEEVADRLERAGFDTLTEAEAAAA